MLVAALGTFVATDAGASAELALVGLAIAELILALALATGRSGAVQWSLALLALVLLLRREDRIALAPVYGAGLLLIGELAERVIELRGVQRIGPGVAGARLAAVVVVAALGACGGVVVTIAVRVAPARSVGFTAVGVAAVLAALAVISRLGRRFGAGAEAAGDPDPDPPQARGDRVIDGDGEQPAVDPQASGGRRGER